MAEQDFVTIPNQPGASGTPTNANIAADDPSATGIGPFVQQVSLANLTAELRNLVQVLSVLGMAQEPTSGRLRVLIDLITANLTLTNIGVIVAFGTTNVATTAAAYMPFDILTDAWSNSVRRNVV